MCPRFQSLVRRYNAGRVSEAEAQQVEAHLEICFDCKRAAARPMSRRELDHSPMLKKNRPVAAWLTLAIAAGVCLALLSGKLSIRSGVPHWPTSAPVVQSGR